MCNQRLWLPAWQLLRQQYPEDYQLIPLVIPSTGSMDELVNSLADLIVEKDAILVGFSLGGYIASAIALKLGSKLKQLLIVSNFPKNLPLAEIKQRKRTVNWINQRGYSGIPNKRIDDLLHPNIKQFNPLSYQDIKQTIVSMDSELGVGVLIHQISVSLNRPNLLPLFSQLTLPITLLVGDEDNLVDLACLGDAIKNQNNVALHAVPNTGHMLPLESPQALTTMLINLLQ